MTTTAGPDGSTEAPTGFAITVPDSWFELDVHPDTRNASIQELVTQRLRDVPELYQHRSGVVRALRSAARNAYAAGAVYCGTMVQGFDEALLSASVTVALVEAPQDDGGAEQVAAQLTSIPRGGPDDAWREVLSVDLPHVGTVPRTRGVEDVVLPDGAGWVRSVLMQTFVPFPGPRPRSVALVTASSPILPLADDLLDLFDAVTSTFRFT